MPERSEAEIEEYLVEIDRRLRGIQLGLAPGREPAPVREATVAAEPPRTDTPPPAPPNNLVTSKLIASMRELLDALESATATSDRPMTY